MPAFVPMVGRPWRAPPRPPHPPGPVRDTSREETDVPQLSAARPRDEGGLRGNEAAGRRPAGAPAGAGVPAPGDRRRVRRRHRDRGEGAAVRPAQQRGQEPRQRRGRAGARDRLQQGPRHPHRRHRRPAPGRRDRRDAGRSRVPQAPEGARREGRERQGREPAPDHALHRGAHPVRDGRPAAGERADALRGAVRVEPRLVHHRGDGHQPGRQARHHLARLRRRPVHALPPPPAARGGAGGDAGPRQERGARGQAAAREADGVRERPFVHRRRSHRRDRQGPRAPLQVRADAIPFT